MNRNLHYQALSAQLEREYLTQHNSKPKSRTPARRRTPKPKSGSNAAGTPVYATHHSPDKRLPDYFMQRNPGGAYHYAQTMNQPRMQSPYFSPMHSNWHYQALRAQQEREFLTQNNTKPKPGTPARRTPKPKSGSIAATPGYPPVYATHHGPDKRLPDYFMQRNPGGAYYGQTTNHPRMQSPSFSPVNKNSDYQAFRAQPQPESSTHCNSKPKRILNPAPSKESITLGTPMETSFDAGRTPEPKAAPILAGTPVYATHQRFPDYFILRGQGGACFAQATNQPRMQSPSMPPVSPK